MQERLISWLAEQSVVLGAAAGISLILLLLSIIAAPWLVSRLPADYLLRPAAPLGELTGLRLFIGFIRNLIAFFLLLLGLIMLLTPGPGLIMLLIAMSIAQIPGKQKLIRRLATRQSVFNTLNWMRSKHQALPLIHPDTQVHKENYT